MVEAEYSLSVVARRTGLSPQLIRAWEFRHAAIAPRRAANGRRLYKEEDVARLLLLKQLTGAGFAISRIAHHPTAELEELATRDGVSLAAAAPTERASLPTYAEPAAFVADAIDAVRQLNSERLLATLDAADVALGRAALLEQIVAALAEQVGAAWRSGQLKVAHEHFATAQLRGYLGPFGRVPHLSAATPHLIVTTPPDQWHELGALLVAAAAHSHGWRVSYLGPSLPVEELAGAAIGYSARAVALSVVYPEDDPHFERELTRLRRLLPEGTAILVGGRGSAAYAPVLASIRAIRLSSLSELYPALDALRRPAS